MATTFTPRSLMEAAYCTASITAALVKYVPSADTLLQRPAARSGWV